MRMRVDPTAGIFRSAARVRGDARRAEDYDPQKKRHAAIDEAGRQKFLKAPREVKDLAKFRETRDALYKESEAATLAEPKPEGATWTRFRSRPKGRSPLTGAIEGAGGL